MDMEVTKKPISQVAIEVLRTVADARITAFCKRHKIKLDDHEHDGMVAGYTQAIIELMDGTMKLQVLTYDKEKGQEDRG
jgi:hypothetical protein